MSDMENSELKEQSRHSFRLWAEFRAFMRDRFSLEDDKASQDEVAANISKGTEFRGVNLWVLICATMVASLGLNVNSAAVIIGAMCISPIMGPIMGIGFSLGINDFDLLQSSYVELLDEKNRQIAEMKQRLARYQVTNVDIGDISQEVGVMSDNVESMSLTKGVMFDVAGKPLDTLLVCVITPKDFQRQIDREQLRKWLSVRTKVDNVKLFVEPKSNE